MNPKEFPHILGAIIIYTLIASLFFMIRGQFDLIALAFLSCAVIITLNILAKKTMAHLLDADVEHETWLMERYGLRGNWKLKKPIPAGIIFPLFLSVFSIGLFKVPVFLTYETRALKHRAAKRHGFYSFTEITDWHNALIGAAGILSLLIISFIAYFLPIPNIEFFVKLSIYYAFWNLVPISKLDGTQIFFGSRILWYTLAIITAIFTAFVIIIP